MVLILPQPSYGVLIQLPPPICPTHGAVCGAVRHLAIALTLAGPGAIVKALSMAVAIVTAEACAEGVRCLVVAPSAAVPQHRLQALKVGMQIVLIGTEAVGA